MSIPERGRHGHAACESSRHAERDGYLVDSSRGA